MKKNRISLIILLALAALAIYLLAQNHYSTLKEKEADFSVADTSSVTKLFIADKKLNSVTIQRVSSGWMLDGKYKSNPRLVESLLGTLHRIKVKAPVSSISFNNVVTRMASIGIKVEVYQRVYRIDWFNKIKLLPHEKLTKVFYVGDVTSDNLGTYMLMEGASQPYITYIPGFRGFVSAQFTPQVDDWKSHEIFKKTLGEIKSVRLNNIQIPEEGFLLEVKNASGNYDLRRITDNNRVERYDTLKVLNLLTSFVDVRYETRMNNLMSGMQMDSIIHSPGLFELTLVDIHGDTTYVKMFERRESPVDTSSYDEFYSTDQDRLYGLVNDGEDFVLLQYYSMDKLLNPLSYYEKKPGKK
ncbi:MAG: hypothetical protein WC341_11685 [Bacteroidales bacterium]|jgi:hypothetical protein